MSFFGVKSLRGPIPLTVAILLLAAMAAVLRFDYLRDYKQALDVALRHAESKLLAIAQSRKSALDALMLLPKNSVIFFAEMPPIMKLGALRQSAGGASLASEIDTEKSRIAQIFVASMQRQSRMLQARILVPEHNWRELVRVDRPLPGQPIRIVDEQLLQSKGDRPYVQTGASLQANEVFISAIELNQEFGKAQPVPTLRSVMPLFHGQERWGLLVTNFDAVELFRPVLGAQDSYKRVLVTDAHGKYLVHPDRKRLFEAAFDPQAPGWNEEYSAEPDAFDGSASELPAGLRIFRAPMA